MNTTKKLLFLALLPFWISAMDESVPVTRDDRGIAINKLICSEQGTTPDQILPLIEQGANLEVCTENERTPLLNAAYLGNTQVCELLIKHDANIVAFEDDLDGRYGFGALELAILRKNFDTALRLINLGVTISEAANFLEDITITVKQDPTRNGKNEVTQINEVKLKNFTKWTRNEAPLEDLIIPQAALLILVCTDTVTEKTIERAHTQGADLNAQDATTGMTPLMIAAFLGKTDVCTALIKRGADTTLTCHHPYDNYAFYEGFGPLECAALGEQSGTIQALQERDVKASAKTKMITFHDTAYTFEADRPWRASVCKKLNTHLFEDSHAISIQKNPVIVSFHDGYTLSQKSIKKVIINSTKEPTKEDKNEEEPVNTRSSKTSLSSPINIRSLISLGVVATSGLILVKYLDASNKKESQERSPDTTTENPRDENLLEEVS